MTISKIRSALVELCARLMVLFLTSLSALAVHAATTDDMLIDSDRLNNMAESN